MLEHYLAFPLVEYSVAKQRSSKPALYIYICSVLIGHGLALLKKHKDDASKSSQT